MHTRRVFYGDAKLNLRTLVILDDKLFRASLQQVRPKTDAVLALDALATLCSI
jgi:hypothetical protein